MSVVGTMKRNEVEEPGGEAWEVGGKPGGHSAVQERGRVSRKKAWPAVSDAAGHSGKVITEHWALDSAVWLSFVTLRGPVLVESSGKPQSGEVSRE